MHNHLKPYTQFCANLRLKNLLRHIPSHPASSLDFSNNDYLGLSQHPQLIQTAIDAAAKYGVGSGASRMVTSHSLAHQLEQTIAKSKNTHASIVFCSGFQANLSVISALLDPLVLKAPPLVFSDRLNHASMYHACRMLKIKQFRFNHLDYEHLESLLKKTQSDKGPKFILTESVFGMDGDIACLETIGTIAKKYHALLYVDEAHASGLYGKNGYGLTEDFPHTIDVSMGTFSKALGNSGAYISCSSSLKRYLINRSQGFVYSTAPSPIQIAVMQKSWEMISHLQGQVSQLFILAQTLREKLTSMGFDTLQSTSHIVPVVLKDPKTTLYAQKYLMKKGIKVSAIRPPSVSPNACRLRIALTLKHTQQDIEALLDALNQWSQG